MMGKLWQFAAAALGGLVILLSGLLALTARQKAKAQGKAQRQERRADSAQTSIKQREAAHDASAKAKEAGDATVEQALRRSAPESA
jgi:hypothetical protein